MIARGRGWRIVLSLVAGLALAFAFPNYNLPLLGWVSVAGLIVAVLDARLTEAALCGFAYGAVFSAFSFPWIYTVLRQYGPLPVWQAAGVLLLAVVQQALLYIVFTVPLAWAARRSTPLALILAPFLWVAVELLRTRLPAVGFGWNLLGYTAAGNLALLQIASVMGIYGLSLLVAGYNAVLAGAVASSEFSKQKPAHAGNTRLGINRRMMLWLEFSFALLVVALLGSRFVPAAQPTHVAHLVQTNLPQSTEYPADWDVVHAGDMAQLDSISIAAAQRQPGLIVWPEVPAPFSLQDAGFAQRAQRIARGSGSDFLFGEVDWKRDTGTAGAANAPYNSAALLAPTGREEFLYDKMHLVPFSEYVPWRNVFWFAKDLTALVGDFHHGTQYSVGVLPGGRFSVIICYEAVFPNQVRQFARNGAGLLINLSNDGWFGRSSAPAQHLAMARVRAVENRRWLLRGTNNGFTVSVDPYGRIVASMPPDVRGELDAPYAFRGDLTMYTSFGDWIAWLSLGASAGVLLLCLRVQPKRKQQARATRRRHTKARQVTKSKVPQGLIS